MQDSHISVMRLGMLIKSSNNRRTFRLLAAFIFAIATFSACGKSSGSGNDTAADRMSSTLFGINLSWERLGDNIMENGDLLRDSSFRYFDDANTSTEDVWIKIGESGTGIISPVISTVDPGYTPPAGTNIKAHTGYLNISQSSANTFTGVFQQLKSPAKAGEDYTLSLSTFGSSGDIDVFVCLYDGSTVIQASETTTASHNTWTRHNITLTPTADAVSMGIYLYDNTPGEIKVDEVRLYKKDTAPVVKTAVKIKLRDMGATSLRWPGGTLADWFKWKDSIGPLSERGETATYNGFETPALGLHEFLNLCEELNIRPLIIVNVRDGAQDAADLVEYILGSSKTAQGSIRKANGRTDPWDAVYFEISNEPPAPGSHDYSSGSGTENMGADYAARADTIIQAMRDKSSEIGKTIFLSSIAETAFQLPDWLSTSSTSEIVRMIAKWNSQVFGGTLLSQIDFTHGHFYSSRYYHTDTPGVSGGTLVPEDHFKYLMTGGEVLKKTINEKIKPLTGTLPLWITEYQVLIEEEGNPMPYFQYCMDYQSGLSIADMLMKMIESGVSNAYAWNLSQDGSFGLLGSSDGWYYRPGGLVFKMLSVIDGEDKITVTHNNTEKVTLPTGYGNSPSGLNYDVVSALATKNQITGKPRLFLINRDYTADKTVTINLQEFTPGSGKVYLYNNPNLLADNETSPHNTISLSESTQAFTSPLTVSIPAHSFMRIDF